LVPPALKALKVALLVNRAAGVIQTVDSFRSPNSPLPELTGLEGLPTLAEMVADFRAGAQVLAGFPLPPPFPPPPFNTALLDAARGALGAVADALAQIWSLFNQPQETPTNWEGPTGENIIPWGVVQGGRDGSGSMQPIVQHWDEGGFALSPNVPENARVFAYFQHLGNFSNGQPRGWIFAYQAHRPDGTITGHCVQNANGFCLPDNTSVAEGPRLQVLGWEYAPDTSDAPDVFPPVLVPEPVSTPAYLPATAPIPEVTPGSPLPFTQPQPQAPGEVAPPTTTTPTAPPATLPRTPAYPQPTPTQQPTQIGQETAPDGELVPLPLPLPTPTSPTDHVINGERVPANGPAPTLTGISQELGRLERKAAQMLDPGRAPTGPNIDRLGLLADLLGSLVEAVFFLQQGGEYEISSPCELTEAGDRVPVVVPFAGALSSFGVLSNKVDALAGLLQAHKDLKQPICKQTPAIGEPVTVNFEQVN
jgi:hypothetical protein